MSDLIDNNPSADGISLHNGNIIAVGVNNETWAICFTCLAPLSVFSSGTVHSASTKSVASSTKVQEQVADVVKIQEAVTSDVEVQDVNDNGLNFLPECNESCFVGKKNILCAPIFVEMNKSMLLETKFCFHQKCGTMDTSMKSPTSISSQPNYSQNLREDTERFSCSFNAGQQEIITGQLGTTFGEYAIVKDLNDDLLENWDTMYSAIDYSPPKMFGGIPIDPKLNWQIPFEKLDERPCIKALVIHLEEIFPYLTIDRIALQVIGKI